MARRRRPRRIKFKPFRMGERTRNSILVGLGVFLMAIFAVPFRGSCQRHRVGGRSPNEVFARFAGRRILYGQVLETRRLCHLIFRMSLTDEQAARRLADYYEAERAGIRVSDAEVVDAIRNQIFPRRYKVEYVVAEDAAFGKDAPVPETEIRQAYERQKATRFQKPDKTFRPLSEVRDILLSELRSRKGHPLARAALEKLKKQVDALVGAPLENALKRLAAGTKLRFGETRVFTARTATRELREIADAPDLMRRVATQPIGTLSDPLPITGGWCVLRVVSRSRGFDADGVFCPDEEGWVRQGFGVINVKTYDEVLKETGVTQAELEATVRQDLALVLLPSLVVSSITDLPLEALRARYRRDNTQAEAAYLALPASAFTDEVKCSDDELRDFYTRYKDIPRTEGRPGYKQPERVTIEYVLGRRDDVAATLTDDQVRKYYERHARFFGASFDKAKDDVRKRLADEKLKATITQIANRAADQAATGQLPDLKAITAQEARGTEKAYTVRTTPPFGANETDFLVPELAGAKLADILFGDRGKQYSPEVPPKPGTHAISEIFACNTGRFFFRLLKRQPSRDIPYDSLPPDVRAQLVRDATRDKAFAKAKEKAKEYRAEIQKAAFEQFARKTATKPLDTGFLTAKDPLPSVGKPIPQLQEKLAAGEVGDLSDIVLAPDRYLLARLAAREPAKGIRLQLVSLPRQGLKLEYQPSEYELRAAYADDPYAYLDPPKPIPFDKVKGEITKLLARRKAIELAAQRTEKALADLVGAKPPDIAAAAAKHGLEIRRGVAVDLARPEATPLIGKAAGFRDAVTALKPGEVSRVLASARGKFIFVVKTRNEKAATLDLAAALYAPLEAKAGIKEADARKYYDQHRDTAYVAADEIKPPPSWSAAPPTARARVRDKLLKAWAAKPPRQQLAALRDSLVFEAFRTLPTARPLTTTRQIKLATETIGPFPAERPEGALATEPKALAAIRALKPGQATRPIATRDGALIALLAQRRPGGYARAKVAIFRAADFAQAAPRPDDAAIEKYFAQHKARFRIPEQATVEFLFAQLAPRQKAIMAKLTDTECRRYFEQRAGAEYAGHSYEEIEYRVRKDLARQRAADEARAAARRALEALKNSPNPAQAPFAELARKHGLAAGKTQPFPLEDPVAVAPLGRAVALAADLAKAAPGHVVPHVVETSNGFAVCRLAARTPARDATLAEARERVAQVIRAQAIRAAMAKAAEAFRAAAAASSFDKAAQRATPAPRIVETGRLEARRFVLPGEKPAPALADAIFALDKPGLTPVVTTDSPARAFVAQVTQREPEELLTVEAAFLRHWRLGPPATRQPSDDELKKHYAANKDDFRTPETVQVDYLAANYDELAKTLKATDAELRREYDRSVAAGEVAYRDWAALTQPAYRKFDDVKQLVKRRLLRARAKAQARRLIAQALAALRPQGAKADPKAYAAKHPPLVAGRTDFFDNTRKGLAPIGPAPDLARVAFAAAKGQWTGPVKGSDGVCILRVAQRKPATLPPFDQIRLRVQMHWERQQAIQRAVAALASLSDHVQAALEKAPEAGRLAAFRHAVQANPIAVEVPRPISVTLAKPFHPPGAGWGKSSAITGLGEKPELARAIFAQKPAHLTPVIEDPDRSACYLALLTRIIEPPEPNDTDLMMTRYMLADITRRMAIGSWQYYLERQMQRD